MPQQQEAEVVDMFGRSSADDASDASATRSEVAFEREATQAGDRWRVRALLTPGLAVALTVLGGVAGLAAFVYHSRRRPESEEAAEPQEAPPATHTPEEG